MIAGMDVKERIARKLQMTELHPDTHLLCFDAALVDHVVELIARYGGAPESRR